MKKRLNISLDEDTEQASLTMITAADIYVMLQWKYNFPSASISLAIPAEEMIKAYYPLHETSYNNACEKLYHKLNILKRAILNENKLFS